MSFLPRRLAAMVTPPRSPDSRPSRPPRWQGWILNALYSIDRRTIGDWVGLMADHLQQRATPMATAQYTVQLIHYTYDVRSAAQRLAAHGHPAGRALLADAALNLNAALDNLYDARDALLKAAGADRVSNTDD
jgi:hypothetical protein